MDSDFKQLTSTIASCHKILVMLLCAYEALLLLGTKQSDSQQVVARMNGIHYRSRAANHGFAPKKILLIVAVLLRRMNIAAALR